jgi:broad specificity phosphatase PhoE
MPEIWLIRHAPTEWSATGRHTGRTDVPLTDAGREAARALAPLLAEHRFARVLVSPLSRARETADLAGIGEGAEVRDELVEWDYGEYEGRTTPDIRKERPRWFLWRDGVPGGESAFDVARRVNPLVDELARAEGDVAIVSHGHVLRVLTSRWLGLPPVDGALFALDAATISMLGWERDVRVLRRWNQPTTG